MQVAQARDLQAAPADVGRPNDGVRLTDRVIVQYKVSSAYPSDKPRYRSMPVNPSETVEQAIARYQRDPRTSFYHC